MADNPYLPEDTPEENGETRPSSLPELDITQSAKSTKNIPPAPIPAQGQQSKRSTYYIPQANIRHEARHRRKKAPRHYRDSGFYLPVWSVILMLGVVLIIAFGVVLVVANIGIKNVPESQPRIVIITAVPSNTPETLGSVLASPTIPPESDPGLTQPLPTFALEGPTLEPVVFTPTPDVISVGRTVIVKGVSDVQLNVRDNPDTANTNILFRVPDGYIFTVIDGPQENAGYTWWKVHDSSTAQSGWVVSNYIEVVPQQ